MLQRTTTRPTRTDQSGFTLVELLIVIGVIAILMAITLIAINPIQQFKNARNAQRQADVTSLLDAIYQYAATNAGTMPAGLTSITVNTPYNIATTGANHVDLCSTGGILVPSYLADLPSDPSQSSPRTPSGSICTAATAYTTGYTITRSTTGDRFTVTAPLAENGATISATR